MYCIYLTTYHGKDMPLFYIGSSSVERVNNGYRGSVLSKEYGDIWKKRLKENPELFTTKIIATYETREEAYIKEAKIQKSFNVADNPLYINKTIASGNGRFGAGFKGKYHTEEHKEYMRNLYKGRCAYWVPKKRPEHAEKMKGNQYAKGNRFTLSDSARESKVGNTNASGNKGKRRPDVSKRLLGTKRPDIAIAQMGKHWWNNGEVNRYQKDCPGEDFVPGMLPSPSIGINKRGKHWWNNGEVTKLSLECPGEGFIRGRLLPPTPKQ